MSEPVRHSIEVRCSVDHAFAVFTARLDLWWPRNHRRTRDAELTMEGRAGGRFFERDAEGGEHELGQVIAWQPPTRLAYTWHPGALTLPTEVEVRFSARGEGTLVEVVHREASAAMGAEWPVRAQRFDAAWRHLLPEFIALAESGEPPTGAS
ncbi:MAG: SRPBCC domain-containing protein [Myxococcota bacterium]